MERIYCNPGSVAEFPFDTFSLANNELAAVTQKSGGTLALHLTRTSNFSDDIVIPFWDGVTGTPHTYYRVFSDIAGAYVVNIDTSEVAIEPGAVYRLYFVDAEIGDVDISGQCVRSVVFAGVDANLVSVNSTEVVASSDPVAQIEAILGAVEKLVARFFHKVVLDKNAGTITVYEPDGTTPFTVQVFSSNANEEVIEAPSE